MKVLVITREFPPYCKGGGGRVCEYLLKYSQDYGIKLTIISGHPYLKSVREEYRGVDLYRIPLLGNNFLTKIPTFFSF